MYLYYAHMYISAQGCSTRTWPGVLNEELFISAFPTVTGCVPGSRYCTATTYLLVLAGLAPHTPSWRE